LFIAYSFSPIILTNSKTQTGLRPPKLVACFPVNPIDKGLRQMDSVYRAGGNAASFIPALTAENNVGRFTLGLVWQKEVGQADFHAPVASGAKFGVDDHRAVGSVFGYDPAGFG
jgi:hypothetical protein